MANPLMHETIWFDKWRYDDAETHYQEHLAKTLNPQEVRVHDKHPMEYIYTKCFVFFV